MNNDYLQFFPFSLTIDLIKKKDFDDIIYGNY